MPYFIKLNKSHVIQGFMQTGIFIDYSIPDWAEKEQQAKIRKSYNNDELLIERMIKYHPQHISELISKIYYDLIKEIDLPDHIIYIRPKLKEILDIYNGVLNEQKDYDELLVKSRFGNIHEIATEYFSILDDNKRLREDYKIEQENVYKGLLDEEKDKAPGEKKPASQIANEIHQTCKEKFHPLFLNLYNRMREYSEEARKFFFEESNLKCPAGYDFFKWSDIRKNWINWDQSFYFQNFSPFEKKIKSAPLFDLSPDDEDEIMRSLGRGEGDAYGF
jgi:hypothetical protein